MTGCPAPPRSSTLPPGRQTSISLRTPNRPAGRCPARWRSRYPAGGAACRGSRSRRCSRRLRARGGRCCGRCGGRTGRRIPLSRSPRAPSRRPRRRWAAFRTPRVAARAGPPRPGPGRRSRRSAGSPGHVLPEKIDAREIGVKPRRGKARAEVEQQQAAAADHRSSLGRRRIMKGRPSGHRRRRRASPRGRTPPAPSGRERSPAARARSPACSRARAGRLPARPLSRLALSNSAARSCDASSSGVRHAHELGHEDSALDTDSPGPSIAPAPACRRHPADRRNFVARRILHRHPA